MHRNAVSHGHAHSFHLARDPGEAHSDSGRVGTLGVERCGNGTVPISINNGDVEHLELLLP
jgi:hypothetical protein